MTINFFLSSVCITCFFLRYDKKKGAHVNASNNKKKESPKPRAEEEAPKKKRHTKDDWKANLISVIFFFFLQNKTYIFFLALRLVILIPYLDFGSNNHEKINLFSKNNHLYAKMLTVGVLLCLSLNTGNPFFCWSNKFFSSCFINGTMGPVTKRNKTNRAPSKKRIQ